MRYPRPQQPLPHGRAARQTPQPSQLPDDPSQEMLPIAQPEPEPASGVPVQFEADRQTRLARRAHSRRQCGGALPRLLLRADKVVYDQSTSVLEADGHLQVSGGPNDVLINASHGDMRLNMHTARFYNVSGSQGIHSRGTHRGLLHAPPRFYLPAGCCCRPARRTTALSTAP